jgi:hypothetical protein
MTDVKHTHEGKNTSEELRENVPEGYAFHGN